MKKYLLLGLVMLLCPIKLAKANSMLIDELAEGILDYALEATTLEERIFISDKDRELINLVKPILEDYRLSEANTERGSISIPLTYEEIKGVQVIEISQDEDGIYVGYERNDERYYLFYFSDGAVMKDISRYYDDGFIMNHNFNNEKLTSTDCRTNVCQSREELVELDPTIIGLMQQNMRLKWYLISGGLTFLGCLMVLWIWIRKKFKWGNLKQ